MSENNRYPGMKKLSILIIDDDEQVQELLEAAVQEIGHTSRTAAGLKEGYEKLKKFGADILILDRGLPDGDGIQLCLTIRKDLRYKNLPILMLTGKSEAGDKVLGLRFGADDYLAKPFDMEELLARVDALIRRIPPGPSVSDRRRREDPA